MPLKKFDRITKDCNATRFIIDNQPYPLINIDCDGEGLDPRYKRSPFQIRIGDNWVTVGQIISSNMGYMFLMDEEKFREFLSESTFLSIDWPDGAPPELAARLGLKSFRLGMKSIEAPKIEELHDIDEDEKRYWPNGMPPVYPEDADED